MYYKKLRVFIIFFIGIPFIINAQNIYIITHPSVANNYLFEINSNYAALKKACNILGYNLSTVTHDQILDNPFHVIVFEMPHNNNLTPAIQSVPLEKRTLVLWEPPLILPSSYSKVLHSHFGKVFTIWDICRDDKKYKKIFGTFQSKPQITYKNFNQKHFCTAIIGNRYAHGLEELYSERRSTIEFFEKYHPDDFEFYGTWWDKITNPSYRGEVKNKKEILENYKFCICYENSKNIKGYISEKIFDCFVAGVVPVYWGADDITNYIPEDCFIDRRKFKSHEELYLFLKNITEENYFNYYFAIERFMSSSNFFLFTNSFFMDTLLENMFHHYDKTLIFSAEDQSKILQTQEVLDVIIKAACA